MTHMLEFGKLELMKGPLENAMTMKNNPLTYIFTMPLATVAWGHVQLMVLSNDTLRSQQ